MGCCGSSSFCKQFSILAWKNYILKKRHFGVLLLELLVPIGLFCAILGLQQIVDQKVSVKTIPDTYLSGSDFSSIVTQTSCFTSILWQCSDTCKNFYTDCQPRKVAVAPVSSSATSAVTAASNLVTWANGRYGNHTSFTYFNSESDFLTYMGQPSYSIDPAIPIYSSAVIFNHGYPGYDYTMRMNKTIARVSSKSNGVSPPDTSLPFVDLKIKSATASPSSGGGQPYATAYLYSNYFSLTDVVDSYLASTINNANVTLTMAGIANFPNDDALQSGFWSIIGFLLPLVIIIGIMYPLANIISALVMEKESKIREGMMMMALHGEALWASWLFHFLCLFVPLAIILTLIGTKVFPHTEPIYVFFYFMLFFLSSIAYCVFISVFFSNSRTAAIVGNLIFLGGFFVYIGLQTSSPDRSTLLAACLHPSAAFTYGTLAFIEYEDAAIGITSNTWNVSSQYSITFQDVLTMMVIDTIYLLVIAWYFANIWPSEFGTHKPWYFPILPSYWLSFCFSRRPSAVSSYEDEYLNPRVQKVADNLLAQKEQNICVEVKGLVKYFETNTGRKTAVDGLNLTMYSGQITALLGHNGAGKSTTIAMLTGLIAPDGGTAIIEGFDINKDMESIRKNLGVCPQHNILFDDLTVQEHLIMFASFKGTPRAELKEEVEKMIQSVGLTEKRHIRSKQLSGGQKRKLSVGIAFIGGSRIVFLDEPTSGMDPYSRRFTWNVIRQHREGRVIVLTTHFMDEADLLGDRVAIMGDGKLQCCGSSLFLKSMFGVGYNMVLEKTDPVKFKSAEVQSLVTSRIESAKLLTDVGAEMAFQLPLGSSDKFQALFDHLDQNLDSLGIRSYGMSVTTLEEVFIKVAEGTNTEAEALAGINIKKGNKYESLDVESRANQDHSFTRLNDDDTFSLFIRHVYALMMKRFLYNRRDVKSIIFQLFIPVIFVLIGMIVMYVTNANTDQPNVPLVASMFNSGSTNRLPTPIANADLFCIDASSICQSFTLDQQKIILSKIPQSATFPLIPLTDFGKSIQNVSNYLFTHRNDYKASQFGAISFKSITAGSGYQYFVHPNYTGVHAAPLFNSLAVSSILTTLDGTASVTTSIHPLPATAKQAAILNNYNVDTVVTFIMLAIPFISAGFITFVVRENEIRAKAQQMVSGVSVFAYWISTWLSDILIYQPTVWLIIMLLCAFPNTSQLTGPNTFGPTIGLLLLFGPAMAGFTYLMSFFFKSASGAQVIAIFVVFLLGLVLSIIGEVLRIVSSSSAQYFQFIRYIFAVFPPFALGDGLHSMTLIDTYSALELTGGKTYDPLDMKITGVPLIFLGFESVLYVGIAILAEYLITIPSFQARFNITHLPGMDTSNLKDNDVIAEEDRVQSGAATETSTILVDDFKKVYPGGKYAVKGVSLGIPNGECFGLLGINGAGKSTFLAMLSGEFPPSSGAATLGGLNLLTDVFKVRRRIGFCPQFDALFDLLTGREHLTLYAHIKGIATADVAKVVNGKIAEMGLTEYADRSAGSYSGGNKRKLSVAIAMIGEPSLVFLDEPSTGMDPVARRHMWEIISDIVTKREKCSLILTTHSMEECEALCTRVGIMVGGVLRCLGSSQHLKSKYGHGYQIELSFIIPTQAMIDTQTELIQNVSKTTRRTSFLGGTTAAVVDTLDRSQVEVVLESLGHRNWIERIQPGASGSDIDMYIRTHSGVDVKNMALFCIMEEAYDNLATYFTSIFGAFILRERQPTKVRIEISSVDGNNTPRKLSSMFGSIEGKKNELKIQEYSICQTSLEQIFNQFASQQEEELGNAAGIRR